MLTKNVIAKSFQKVAGAQAGCSQSYTNTQVSPQNGFLVTSQCVCTYLLTREFLVPNTGEFSGMSPALAPCSGHPPQEMEHWAEETCGMTQHIRFHIWEQSHIIF